MIAWLLAGCGLLLAGRTTAARHRRAPDPGPHRPRLPPVLGVGLGVACVVVAGHLGVFLAVPVGVGSTALAARLLRRADRAGTDPGPAALVVDLLAAVLAAGAPPDLAITAVCEAVAERGPTASAASLYRVGRLLQLGTEPAEAWTALAENPGWAGVAAAGRRCATSGARLAGALSDVAVELRAQRRESAIARAERVGIWTLLPLGCCFLPAFVCLGIAPVVVGMAGQLLSTRP